MKKLSLKYYKLSLAAFLFFLSAMLYLTMNYLVGLFINDRFCFFTQQIVVLFFSFISIGTFLSIFNEYGFGVFYCLFGLPDLRGEYEGTLISSYHIDDDKSKPNITKHVKLTISQNLNGFYVESFYYDHEAAIKYSSESYSVSHDIDEKDNGEFIITYRYKNKKNDFHEDHQKYTLNNHDGICILTYNAKNKTLIGKYFNDSSDRPSYGQLNLILNPKK